MKREKFIFKNIMQHNFQLKSSVCLISRVGCHDKVTQKYYARKRLCKAICGHNIFRKTGIAFRRYFRHQNGGQTCSIHQRLHM